TYPSEVVIAGLFSYCIQQEKRISRGRILGGTSALPGAHPWMAALYIADEFCAGALVSSCWIVSAAHCFLRKYVSVCALHAFL
uniref:trypsin n=1 Tax=Sinocyclocheilus grahami TaxID=75366 RepID=A0A672K9X6_SINGR